MGVGANETMTFINQTYQRADAILFGRRTYELFAGYWVWGCVNPIRIEIAAHVRLADRLLGSRRRAAGPI